MKCMFLTIIIFLLLLSVLVFAHELGHFFVARKMGMKVEEFGFGFPPRIFGIKKGKTVYSFNLIPLGGFVRIKGESGEHKEDQDSFASKPARKRFAVLIAGVTMNMVLAAALLMIGFAMGLPSVIDGDLPKQVVVKDQAIRIVSLVAESPAQRAGIQIGDTLLSLDGKIFETSLEAREYIHAAEHPIQVFLQREQEQVFLSVEGAFLQETGEKGIGIGLVETGFISYPWYQAIGQGFLATGILTWEILKAFADILKNLVMEQKAGVELSGPVGIAVMTGQVAALGIRYLLQFAALLSINLAILNVLPFPALDGGRILFLFLEKIRKGKPINEKIESLVHNLGFLFLMAIVVLVTYQDIVKFFVK